MASIPARRERRLEGRVAGIAPGREPGTAAAPRPRFRERDQSIEDRRRIGNGPDRVEHGDRSPRRHRSQVADRDEPQDGPCGVLGDVDVARERREGPPIEPLLARVGRHGQQRPDAREVAAPSASHVDRLPGGNHARGRLSTRVACLQPRRRDGKHAVVAHDDDAIMPLTIERLTFGPDALAHVDGQVAFVPLAAPGDRVLARVVRRERGYLRAELVEVLEAGPNRVPPPCPAFGRCGGCQWQHVALAAQRQAKRAIVAEQLARLGGFRDVDVRPTLAANMGLAYRARVTLIAEGRRLGYQRRASHVLEEIDACPIAAAAINAHLALVRGWAARLRAAPIRVTIAEAPDGVALAATLRSAPPPGDVADTEALLVAHGSIRGVVLTHGDTRVTVGDAVIPTTIEPGAVIEAPADAFAQVNPDANRLLVQTVLTFGNFAAGSRVADLYCGAGNFTVPLARRGVHMVGIERDARAVAAARANATRLGLDARFVVGDVADQLERLTEPIVGAVLDPPRAGAAEAIAALVARAPRRVVYVSCDPATLARDLKTLASHGYALRAVQPIDLFPQTFHVETVALIELT